MKKIFTLAAAAAVAISCMSFPASAETTIIEGGLDLTSGISAHGDGYTWDASTRTLTLSNVTISGESKESGEGIWIGETDQPTTIVLEGKNYIRGFRSAFDDGNSYITSDNGLTIIGEGSLEISDCQYASNDLIYLIVDGAEIISTADSGFICFAKFEAKNNAVIDISANGEDAISPIYTCGDIILSDSKVNVDIGDTNYPAIFATGNGYKDAPVIRITNTELTLNGAGWGMACQCDDDITESGKIEIANSTLFVNSAAGMYSGGINVDGNSKLLTDKNKQVLRTLKDTDIITVAAGAVVEGYSNKGGSMLSFDTDYTLKEDFEIAENRTLTIPEGVTLTLAGNTKLTAADDTAAIYNKGTILKDCNSDAVVQITEGDAPKAIHKYTNYVYNNDAQIGVDGTETAECDYGCGEKDTRTAVGTALKDDSSEESSDVTSSNESSDKDSSAADSMSSDSESESLAESSKEASSENSSADKNSDKNPVTGVAAGSALLIIAGAALTVVKKKK